MASSMLLNPQMNWDSGNIEENWKKFLRHAKLVFCGPLASKSEEQHVSYFLIWIGQKGRPFTTHGNLLRTSKRSLISCMQSSRNISHPDQTKYFHDLNSTNMFNKRVKVLISLSQNSNCLLKIVDIPNLKKWYATG